MSLSIKHQCIACLSKNSVDSNFLVAKKFPLFHCRDCGLSYLDLADDEDEEQAFDEYWSEINQKIYTNPKVINELKQKYLFYFNKIRNTPNNKLLDVGSGAGICVNTAIQKGFDAMGIEPSSNGVELSKSSYGINVVNALLRPDDDLPRDFAILTLWDVIEHVSNPEELVTTCAEHLSDKGYLILETPDEGAFIRKIIKLLGRNISFLDMRHFLYYRAHRYYFTVQAMTTLLERCGFDNITFYKEHSMYQKGLLKDKLYRGRSNYADNMYRMGLWLLTKIPFFGNKMVVIARKSSS